jgi:hypothetical protein
MDWIVIGFVILIALALRWDFENVTNKLAARLQTIEISLEKIDEKLLIIGSDTTRATKALDRKQETIEERWLRENYSPPAA